MMHASRSSPLCGDASDEVALCAARRQGMTPMKARYSLARYSSTASRGLWSEGACSSPLWCFCFNFSLFFEDLAKLVAMDGQTTGS